jgi:hypothetical protein
VLLISNLTVSGQFTPQRLIINGNPGIFLTPAQEKSILNALIDYKYCSKSIVLKDSIILDLNNAIGDKNFEINLLTTKYNKCIGDAKIYAENYNSLLEVHNKLQEEHNVLKLKHSKSINWNIGLGCSTLLLGVLLILTN